MGNALPGISVVIPTMNRSRYIPSLLTTLREAAENFSGQSEVIVIDDSSPVEADIIQRLCEEYGALYLPGPASVRQKRNIGIRSAQQPIVLFVDSDCQATPDLFTQHARTYVEADRTLGGVVGVTEFIGDDGWMWDVITRTQFLNAFSFARRMEFAPWATCTNTSYRRDVLNELGGFDTNFPFRLGGDDVDLGLRLNNANYRIRCNPAAKVFHTRETWGSFGAVWRRAFRWGRMDLHLYYRKHRDRVAVGLPKFMHVFLLLALAGLAQTMLTGSFWPLVPPLIWLVLTLVLQAAATVFLAAEGWRYFVHELLADLLGLTFEAGALIEGVIRLEPAVLFKSVQRGPVLPDFERREWLAQMWCMWLGVALTLFIQRALP